AHSTDAGENHPVGAENALAVGGDLYLSIGRYLTDGTGNRVEVTHAVINDGNAGTARHKSLSLYSLPLVEGIMPLMRGSAVKAMRNARPKALKIVSAWWWTLAPF